MKLSVCEIGTTRNYRNDWNDRNDRQGVTAESRKDRKAGTTGKAGSLGNINASCVNRGISSKITYSGELAAPLRFRGFFPSSRIGIYFWGKDYSVPYWTPLTRYKGQKNLKRWNQFSPYRLLLQNLACFKKPKRNTFKMAARINTHKKEDYRGPRPILNTAAQLYI